MIQFSQYYPHIQSICTALLLAVQGCRATGPAVTIYTQMRCCWLHRAAELRSLQSQSMCTALLYILRCCWRHRAAQSHGACSHNLCTTR